MYDVNNFDGWNKDQIRALEYWLTDSLPYASGLEVTGIEELVNEWLVHYVYEGTDGKDCRGKDYFIGNLTHNGFTDFQIHNIKGAL